MENVTEDVSLIIDIEHLDILTCTDEDLVYLRGKTEMYSDEEEKDCVFILSKNVLHEMIDEWLEGKKQYYNYGSWAGVGYFEITEYEELLEEERCWLMYFKIDKDDPDNEEKWSYEKRFARTFIVLDYDMQMEHG